MPAVCNRGILEKRRGRVYNGHVQKKKEEERVPDQCIGGEEDNAG